MALISEKFCTKKLKPKTSDSTQKYCFIIPYSPVDTQGQNDRRNEINCGRFLSTSDKIPEEDEDKAQEGATKIRQVGASKERKADIYVNRFILHTLQE